MTESTSHTEPLAHPTMLALEMKGI
ncbi:MAG: hypothetical protein QOF33_4210, partial [Thermomicrobiales bacterium]|nr:hypothetical protein [Thermomicrobiales bacterium]